MQRSAGVCSTGFVERGLRLRIAKQYLSGTFVRWHGVVIRHYCQRIARSAGAVLPFEWMWLLLGS